MPPREGPRRGRRQRGRNPALIVCGAGPPGRRGRGRAGPRRGLPAPTPRAPGAPRCSRGPGSPGWGASLPPGLTGAQDSGSAAGLQLEPSWLGAPRTHTVRTRAGTAPRFSVARVGTWLPPSRSVTVPWAPWTRLGTTFPRRAGGARGSSEPAQPSRIQPRSRRGGPGSWQTLPSGRAEAGSPWLSRRGSGEGAAAGALHRGGAGALGA